MDNYGWNNANTTANMLLGSKVVVEYEEGIVTGTVLYVEGDLVELEGIGSADVPLGQKVKTTLYTNNGVKSFASSVLAKDNAILTILNHASIRAMFKDMRKDVRVECDLPVVLKSPLSYRSLDGALVDISMAGVCLSVAEPAIPIARGSTFECRFRLESDIACKLAVVHMKEDAEKAVFGAKFTAFPESGLNQLRAYILRNQVCQRHKLRHSD